MPLIEVQNISKKFEDSIAIEDISFTLNDGELLTLLGPSGSGKTTILRLLAGLIQPDKGEILFDNTDVSKIRTEDRNIGFVFQSYALFPHLTVIENIIFGLETRGWSKEAKKERVKELLKLVGLEGKGTRYPRELSGGEQSRVALARAIAPNPSLLLLDEPLSALDVTLRDSLRTAIREIQQKVNISTIYVTHDQKEAMEISDRIIILNEGQIIEEGTPTELYLNPKTVFTANFLGITNIFTGSIKSQENEFLLETKMGTIILPAGNYTTKKEIMITIYPEHLHIQKKKTEKRNEFRAIISKISFAGPIIEYELKIADSSLIVRLKSSREIANYHEKDEISVIIPSNAILVLDK